MTYEEKAKELVEDLIRTPTYEQVLEIAKQIRLIKVDGGDISEEGIKKLIGLMENELRKRNELHKRYEPRKDNEMRFFILTEQFDNSKMLSLIRKLRELTGQGQEED